MHRLLKLESQFFSHQNDVDTVLNSLLSRNQITAANATWAVAPVGHSAVNAHTNTRRAAIEDEE